GGTSGGLVSTAVIGSPCGGPKSPLREPPVSSGVAVCATALATGDTAAVSPPLSLLQPAASSSAASAPASARVVFIETPFALRQVDRRPHGAGLYGCYSTISSPFISAQCPGNEQ